MNVNNLDNEIYWYISYKLVMDFRASLWNIFLYWKQSLKNVAIKDKVSYVLEAYF